MLADGNTGVMRGDAEARILDAIGEDALLVDDVLRFADAAVARVLEDHARYVEVHALGAFRFVDRVFE